MLVVDVVLDMGRAVFREKNRLLNILLPASFVLVFFLQVNVVFVIVGSAAVSLPRALSQEGGNAMELLFNLFGNFLQVGLFSFGGVMLRFR